MNNRPESLKTLAIGVKLHVISGITAFDEILNDYNWEVINHALELGLVVVNNGVFSLPVAEVEVVKPVEEIQSKSVDSEPVQSIDIQSTNIQSITNQTITNQQYPQLQGLKLQNADRATKDGYLFYTGGRADCHLAWADLLEYDVPALARKNGRTGCWCLKVMLADLGNLFINTVYQLEAA